MAWCHYHHLSGYACLFLASTFEDFEDAVYTIVVVAPVKMLEGLLSVWELGCFLEVLVFLLTAVQEAEEPAVVLWASAEEVMVVGALVVVLGALALPTQESLFENSMTELRCY